jgi:hypothetical protein
LLNKLPPFKIEFATKQTYSKSELCGFDPFKGAASVPGKDAFSRFLNLLMKHQTSILEMFHRLVDELKKYLPDLGERSAADSKAIQSFGKPVKDEQKLAEDDRRRDTLCPWSKT